MHFKIVSELPEHPLYLYIYIGSLVMSQCISLVLCNYLLMSQRGCVLLFWPCERTSKRLFSVSWHHTRKYNVSEIEVRFAGKKTTFLFHPPLGICFFFRTLLNLTSSDAKFNANSKISNWSLKKQNFGREKFDLLLNARRADFQLPTPSHSLTSLQKRIKKVVWSRALANFRVKYAKNQVLSPLNAI
jgi:hypothetical protein